MLLLKEKEFKEVLLNPIRSELFASQITCVNCGKKYPLGKYYRCSKCGGILDVQYDYEKMHDQIDLKALFAEKTMNLWKYKELLPIEDSSKIVTLYEGATPLLRSDKLREELNVNLYLKDETRNPTGSFKDRPYTVGVSKANELNVKTVVLSSTGNAAMSLAAHASSAEMKSIVFVPENTSVERISQIQIYGGLVIAVEGTSSDAFKMAYLSSQKYGWYNVTSTLLNPYTVEGDKTLAYEIYEQLGFKSPDWVLIPIGVGALLVGCFKGFKELYQLGLINKLPHMVGVQAEGCSPIVKAFKENKPYVEPWGEPKTIAKSIADPLQGYPEEGTYTLKMIKESGGYTIACSDNDILNSIPLLARKEGIFAEPASITPVPALKKLIEEGKIDKGDCAVCVITGTGLKDTNILTSIHKKTPLISPGQFEYLDRILKVS
jgi:threonine synthase